MDCIRGGGGRQHPFSQNFAGQTVRPIIHEQNRHPGQRLGAAAGHLRVSQGRFPQNFLGGHAFVSKSFVLPPLPRDLLMRGETAIPIGFAIR